MRLRAVCGLEFIKKNKLKFLLEKAGTWCIMVEVKEKEV